MKGKSIYPFFDRFLTMSAIFQLNHCLLYYCYSAITLGKHMETEALGNTGPVHNRPLEEDELDMDMVRSMDGFDCCKCYL